MMIDLKTLESREDRKKIHQVLLSNVERIDMDTDKKRFRVRLMNGVEYVVKTSPDGLVEVTSNDFKTDAFELRKIGLQRPRAK